MEDLYYVGLDVHKKTVSYCVKRLDGSLLSQGVVRSTRTELATWAESLPGPWIGALEATLFTRWIYDTLVPYAREVRVAHAAELKALGAAKNKNDRKSASTIADLLRTNLLPTIKMVSRQTFDLRLVLRLRSFLVRSAVRVHNKMTGLLMEWGVEYEPRRLKGKKYFARLMEHVDVSEDARQLLGCCRRQWESLQAAHKALLENLLAHEALCDRVKRLRTVPGVGEVTALTWALEMGELWRFRSISHAQSYCGLTSAQDTSGGSSRRHRLSKKRNKRLQCALIEAAKLAAGRHSRLRAVYDRERARSHANRATVIVARKLVAWLLAVDRSGKPFEEKRS
jgi:transposase